MEPIFLPQLLKAPDGTEVINFSENLADLETLTPVKGWIKVTHQGAYLEVSTQADTIVTLACDRCLQQYNHRLSIETSEMLWFRDQSQEETYEPNTEIEVALEDLVESLVPDGTFDPKEWLYQHLCLAHPQRKLCDADCPGIDVSDSQNKTSQPVDNRWAALESLRNQL